MTRSRHLRVVLLLALLLPTAMAAGEVIDRVLAIVNGRLVTLSDVRTARELHLIDVGAAPDSDAALLDRLVDRTLVLQEVERYAPLEPDAAAVDARVRAIDARLGPRETVQATLQRLGVSEEWLRQWVRDDFRVEAYIAQRFAGSVEPTGEEIENYFRQHPGDLDVDGRPLSPADARQLARERLMDARRRQVVDDWLAGLRRRADITRPGNGTPGG